MNFFSHISQLFTLFPALLLSPCAANLQNIDLVKDMINGFLPETSIILTILTLILVSIYPITAMRKNLTIIVCLLGTMSAFFAVLFSAYSLPDAHEIFYGSYITDPLSLLFKGLFIIGTLMIIQFSLKYLESKYRFETEYFILLLTALLGAMMMCSSNDLIMVFIAVETIGISSYILSGYIRTDLKNNEAALKYLVIGSAVTAILLYGMSYLYGLTGSTLFSEIAVKLQEQPFNYIMFLLLLFIIAGIAYKIALAPFHLWAPDVYEGAPTSYTAFLSVISKSAGVILLIRMMVVLFAQFSVWQIIVASLAVLSMFIGNLTALNQKNIKRLLAYSSISHAGFIVIGVLVGTSAGITSSIYYLLVYLFMQLGAWCAVIMFSNITNSDLISDYAGLVRKRPLLTISFAICLFSLAGLPITSGFFAKFFIFQSAMVAGIEYLWLVIIGLVNSVIALYYYISVIKVMVIDEPSEVVKNLDNDLYSQQFNSKSLNFILGVTVASILFFGIFASPLIDISRYCVEDLINYKRTLIGINNF